VGVERAPVAAVGVAQRVESGVERLASGQRVQVAGEQGDAR